MFIQKPRISKILASGRRYTVMPEELMELHPVSYFVLTKLLASQGRFQWNNARLKGETGNISHRDRERAKAELKARGLLKIVPAVDRSGRWSGQVWFATSTPGDFSEAEAAYREEVTGKPATPRKAGKSASNSRGRKAVKSHQCEEVTEIPAITVSTPSVETEGVEAISSIEHPNHTLPFPSQERDEGSSSNPGESPESSTDLPVYAVKPLPKDAAPRPIRDSLRPEQNWGTDPQRAFRWVRQSRFAAIFRALVPHAPDWTLHSARAFYKALRRGTIMPLDILVMRAIGAYQIARTCPEASSSLEGLCKYWHRIIARLNATDPVYSEWLLARAEVFKAFEPRVAMLGSSLSYLSRDRDWRDRMSEMPPVVALDTLFHLGEGRDEDDTEVLAMRAWLEEEQGYEKTVRAAGQLDILLQSALPGSDVLPKSWLKPLCRELAGNMLEYSVLAEATGRPEHAEEFLGYAADIQSVEP